VPPLAVPFETTAEAATPSSRLMDEALATNHWFSLPTGGVSWSRTGRPYPVFARDARGCHITDVEGRTYLDYIMGWGCALLGHAHERIRRAVSEALGSGGVISLPSVVEMEVTRQLCAEIPCAEMAVFGKNGSDVCTAAVRLARVHTGREQVLVCGYHGWQDWHVEKMGFAATGVLERSRPPVHTFRFNDLADFTRVLHAHRGKVAAVMLEPAGPVEGLNGPLRDADPDFLREVATLTRRAGALLIFDEIITGFRYPQGSVQRATGVVPDLACFGKALSAGMPLSALVGRADVFRAAMGRIYYGPTFKSEVYSLAAAREALQFYREHDVPGHIASYGRRLRDGVNQICRRTGVPAELIGPPFRMALSFEEPSAHRIDLMRTLVQQELLRQGVLTYLGFMLPSYAHDDETLAQTLKAFDHALHELAEALRRDDFAPRLEIPVVGY